MSSGSFFDFHAKFTRQRSGRSSVNESKPADVQPLTVSQLTNQISRVLKSGMPSQVWVKGEISNYSNHRSGHCYLSLRDADSCVDCVIWKDAAAMLKFKPTDGLEVIAGGSIGVYQPRGRYQLYITSLQPLGMGALELAFKQLREKLEREGLFNAERKRPLPRYPHRIVLVTSKDSAAIADMLKVLRRYPWLKLMVYSVRVQGEGAANDIAAAMRHINEAISADVVILGRGGGSLEDLWAFNEEAVARAVASSRIPVITGIGHEVDTSIADLIADYHAHTPTEAAQVVTRHWRDVPAFLEMAGSRLHRAARQQISDARHRLRAVEQHEIFRRPLERIRTLQQLLDERQRALNVAVGDLINTSGERLTAVFRGLEQTIQSRFRTSTDRLSRVVAGLAERHPRHRVRLAAQQLDALQGRLGKSMRAAIRDRVTRIEGMATHLAAIAPERVLLRGFTITLRKQDRRIIRSVREIIPGDVYITRFGDGEIEWIAGNQQMLLFPLSPTGRGS